MKKANEKQGTREKKKNWECVLSEVFREGLSGSQSRGDPEKTRSPHERQQQE